MKRRRASSCSESRASGVRCSPSSATAVWSCRVSASARSPSSLRTEASHLPDRLAGDEAVHVLPADQRNVLAEFRHIEVDQAAAVLVLLRRHLLEDARAGGVGVSETFREIRINAPVLLFGADSQSENLAFGKVYKVAHSRDSKK